MNPDITKTLGHKDNYYEIILLTPASWLEVYYKF